MIHNSHSGNIRFCWFRENSLATLNTMRAFLSRSPIFSWPCLASTLRSNVPPRTRPSRWTRS